MSKQGYGRLLENWYFCINTNLQLNEIKSKEELIFTNLQKYSAIKGIETNMFIIKVKSKWDLTNAQFYSFRNSSWHKSYNYVNLGTRNCTLINNFFDSLVRATPRKKI